MNSITVLEDEKIVIHPNVVEYRSKKQQANVAYKMVFKNDIKFSEFVVLFGNFLNFCRGKVDATV